MKTSEVFKRARARIAAGRHKFICVALQCSRSSMRDRVRAKQVITTRMGSSSTLERWLERAGVPEHAQNFSKMQAYRLRWLDALIKEFEAKGD